MICAKRILDLAFSPGLSQPVRRTCGASPRGAGVARGCACVASSATDGWGPRARVAKQKKGFNPRPGGFELGSLERARGGLATGLQPGLC